MGHGGTLDPLATGVLILGIGRGTKSLQSYLKCTKSYETVVVFGAETDSFDILGKVMGTAGWGNVTKESIAAKLQKFRGTFMQRPPVFSARRVNGERLYDLARRGEEIPKEMLQEREVRVDELELLEFWDEGNHNFRLKPENREEWYDRKGKKRKRKQEDSKGNSPAPPPSKHSKDLKEEDVSGEPLLKTSSGSEIEPMMSGALPVPDDDTDGNEQRTANVPTVVEKDEANSTENEDIPLGPAARIRMTVTSGFYVRSLCHDLSKELGSVGVMAELIRTRQGEFELGRNVLEYTDVEKEEETWGPKVRTFLEEWQKSEAEHD
jgi:tRNA pseudouridine55 synthase